MPPTSIGRRCREELECCPALGNQYRRVYPLAGGLQFTICRSLEAYGGQHDKTKMCREEFSSLRGYTVEVVNVGLSLVGLEFMVGEPMGKASTCEDFRKATSV